MRDEHHEADGFHCAVYTPQSQSTGQFICASSNAVTDLKITNTGHLRSTYKSSFKTVLLIMFLAGIVGTTA
jgi:hypothetical protein